MNMMIDVDAAASLIFEQYPEMTMIAALAQSDAHLRAGSLSAATAWARVAEWLSESETAALARVVA